MSWKRGMNSWLSRYSGCRRRLGHATVRTSRSRRRLTRDRSSCLWWCKTWSSCKKRIACLFKRANKLNHSWTLLRLSMREPRSRVSQSLKNWCRPSKWLAVLRIDLKTSRVNKENSENLRWVDQRSRGRGEEQLVQEVKTLLIVEVQQSTNLSIGLRIKPQPSTTKGKSSEVSSLYSRRKKKRTWTTLLSAATLKSRRHRTLVELRIETKISVLSRADKTQISLPTPDRTPTWSRTRSNRWLTWACKNSWGTNKM